MRVSGVRRWSVHDVLMMLIAKTVREHAQVFDGLRRIVSIGLTQRTCLRVDCLDSMLYERLCSTATSNRAVEHFCLASLLALTAQATHVLVRVLRDAWPLLQNIFLIDIFFW